MQKRQKVIQFIKSEHKKTGKAPSIREICKESGLSKKALYEVFPGRKSEMCAAAGVPKDQASSAVVAKASRALKEKRMREAVANAELSILRRKEEEVVDEAEKARLIDETKKRITKREVQFANASKGKRRMFSDPQRMFEFATHTIGNEHDPLENPSVWDSFIAHCKTHGFDPARTLFQIAGPLQEYEANSDMDDLASHLRFNIECFLIDQEAEQMQATFDDSLRKFNCSYCGRRVTAMFLEGNELHCPCGAIWELACVSCGSKLLFDAKNDSLVCRRCCTPLKFRLPNDHSLKFRISDLC